MDFSDKYNSSAQSFIGQSVFIVRSTRRRCGRVRGLPPTTVAQRSLATTCLIIAWPWHGSRVASDWPFI
eukprot:6209499-Lingulodinium_polyedra.AAC.1